MTKTKKTKKKIRSKKRIFTRKDFLSGDGMVVALWGPAMWHSLHTISFNYPIHPTKEEKKTLQGVYNQSHSRFALQLLSQKSNQTP